MWMKREVDGNIPTSTFQNPCKWGRTQGSYQVQSIGKFCEFSRGNKIRKGKIKEEGGGETERRKSTVLDVTQFNATTGRKRRERQSPRGGGETARSFHQKIILSKKKTTRKRKKKRGERCEINDSFKQPIRLRKRKGHQGNGQKTFSVTWKDLAKCERTWEGGNTNRGRKGGKGGRRIVDINWGK